MYECKARLLLQYRNRKESVPCFFLVFPKQEDPGKVGFIKKEFHVNTNEKISLEFKSETQQDDDLCMFLDSINLHQITKIHQDRQAFSEYAKEKLNSFLDRIFLIEEYREQPYRDFYVIQFPKIENDFRYGCSRNVMNFRMNPASSSIIPIFDFELLENALTSKTNVDKVIREFLTVQNFKNNELKLLSLFRLRELIAWEFSSSSKPKQEKEKQLIIDNNNVSGHNNQVMERVTKYYYKDKNGKEIMAIDGLVKATRDFVAHGKASDKYQRIALNEHFGISIESQEPHEFDRNNDQHLELISACIPKVQKTIEVYLKYLVLGI